MNKSFVIILNFVLIHAVYGMNEVAEKKDWNPEKYKLNSDLQFRAGMAMLAQIQFRGNETVLDIGCGDGRLTVEIAKRVPKGFVLGIDISPKMVKYAAETHTEHKNVIFKLQDISVIEGISELRDIFKPRWNFDVITAFSSWSWIRDQRRAFLNVFKLLSAMGEFRAGLAHEESPYIYARQKMLTHDKWKNFFVNYEIPYYPSNEEKTKKLLEEACLVPVEVRKVGVPRIFETRQQFINWMSAIPAQIDRIPEDRQQEFLDDTVTEYLKEMPADEKGTIRVAIGALVVHARSAFCNDNV